MKKILYCVLFISVLVFYFSCKDPVEHVHTFSDEWSYDENSHWHDSTCGHDVVNDKANHSFSDWIITEEATNTEDGSRYKHCLFCDYKIEEKIHNHFYEFNFKFDDTEHWYECRCGDKINIESHSYSEWTIITEATKAQTGLQTKTCSVCNYVLEEIIPKLPCLEHSFDENWTSNEEKHWHKATCGCGDDVRSDEAEHQFEIKTEESYDSTCTETGLNVYYCVCNHKKEEVIPAKGHAFDTKWTSDETNHWHVSTCGCGEEVRSDEGEHNFVKDDDESYEPTCTKTGLNVYYCSVCNHKKEEGIPAKGHAFDTKWDSDETNHWHPTTCGCDVKDSVDTHQFAIKQEESYEPTCTETGLNVYYCSDCNRKKEEVVDAKGHTYEEGWTTDYTHHWHASSCGCEGEKSGYVEHSYGPWTVTTKPTETVDGIKERTCEICNYVLRVNIGKVPEGFVYVEGTTITGPSVPNGIDTTGAFIRNGIFAEETTTTINDYFIKETEVTQIEYRNDMTGNRVNDKDNITRILENEPSLCVQDSTEYTLFVGETQFYRPVENISWYEAIYYCNILSEKEGLTPAYNITDMVPLYPDIYGNGSNRIKSATVTIVEGANGYRLPTEVEWEFAARGGKDSTQWLYPFSGANMVNSNATDYGSDSGLDSVAWYAYNNKTGTTQSAPETSDVSGSGTHEVGKKDPNALGLYDMSGNVAEWVWDTIVVPNGDGSYGYYKVQRGGAWDQEAYYCSVAYRYYKEPTNTTVRAGFRIVLPVIETIIED